MPETEQMRRLRSGVKDSNQWRAHNKLAVDLQGCDLSRLPLSGIDLHGATLRGADLSGAVLRSANMLHADLEGAVLWCADLSWASLRRANLKKANLKDAVLDYADLTEAELKDAKLTTTLVGVELTRTSPWLAQLYSPSPDRAWREEVRRKLGRGVAFRLVVSGACRVYALASTPNTVFMDMNRSGAARNIECTFVENANCMTRQRRR